MAQATHDHEADPTTTQMEPSPTQIGHADLTLKAHEAEVKGLKDRV